MKLGSFRLRLTSRESALTLAFGVGYTVNDWYARGSYSVAPRVGAD